MNTLEKRIMDFKTARDLYLDSQMVVVKIGNFKTVRRNTNFFGYPTESLDIYIPDLWDISDANNLVQIQQDSILFKDVLNKPYELKIIPVVEWYNTRISEMESELTDLKIQ